MKRARRKVAGAFMMACGNELYQHVGPTSINFLTEHTTAARARELEGNVVAASRRMIIHLLASRYCFLLHGRILQHTLTSIESEPIHEHSRILI